MLSSIKFKLLKHILKKEFLYLLNTFLMLTALFFILMLLFIGKEIFISYADTKRMLLPTAMIMTKESLTSVYQKLQEHNVSKESVLVAKVKNYKDLSIINEINKKRSIPKNFTLIAFDIKPDIYLQVMCHQKEERVKVLDIALRRHKDWIFKFSKLHNCHKKESVKLITSKGNISMKLLRNGRYAKLLYRDDKKQNHILYPFLIQLEQKLFLPYVAYSKFFQLQNQKLSIEAKEHAKMLNSFFKVIFAKSRKRMLLNSEAYSYLIEYKKIPFNARAVHKDFRDSFVVLDEIPLDLKNEKIHLYDKLMLINLSSLSDIEYDATLLFLRDLSIKPSWFQDSIVVSKQEFRIIKEGISQKVTIAIYIVVFGLIIFMIMILKRFALRNLRRYREIFINFLFYAHEIRAITLIMSMLLLFAFLSALGLISLLIAKIDAIFYIYYIDLIPLDAYYILYMLVIVLFGIGVSYYFESRLLDKLIKKESV
ncbi:hypothetical protein MNB_SM-7-1381 [hydrothermal vent metagenome]|uniref:Uncharacterized protein n=1 Tax=hydrothermal vent metagenome TaxID=652676 RepID=A0A1W1BYZ1_9ZZZZ